MTNATMQKSFQKENESITKLVSDHYAPVFRFCARRVGPELAKDAAQETFVTAQKQLAKFQNRSAVSTWLFGIANNHCRNLARKRKTQFEFSRIWHVPPATEPSLIDLTVLREAILKLSPEHREALVMHEIEGLTYEEIGEILAIPPGTVKSRLHHAFENMRKSLTPVNEVLA